MKKALMRILSLVLLAAVCGCCAAAETQETMDRVLDIALPYYTAAVEVAKMSPGYGRNFTDHKPPMPRWCP